MYFCLYSKTCFCSAADVSTLIKRFTVCPFLPFCFLLLNNCFLWEKNILILILRKKWSKQVCRAVYIIAWLSSQWIAKRYGTILKENIEGVSNKVFLSGLVWKSTEKQASVPICCGRCLSDRLAASNSALTSHDGVDDAVFFQIVHEISCKLRCQKEEETWFVCNTCSDTRSHNYKHGKNKQSTNMLSCFCWS